MKNSLWLLVLVAILAMGASSFDGEVVKALNETNKQLARIAISLEKISGQQPGGAVRVK